MDNAVDSAEANVSFRDGRVLFWMPNETELPLLFVNLVAGGTGQSGTPAKARDIASVSPSSTILLRASCDWHRVPPNSLLSIVATKHTIKVATVQKLGEIGKQKD